MRALTSRATEKRGLGDRCGALRYVSVRGKLSWLVRSLATLVVIACCACEAPEKRGAGIDVESALATVHQLATVIGPRQRDTEASRRTASWIEGQLVSAGIAVEKLEVGTVELPPITVMGTVHRQAHTVRVTDPNLVVRFGSGSGKALLIIAHYDSVPESPGAVDNAAGVAIVLELARKLHAEPPTQSVMLAFTAAEEVGLAGAEALAAEYADRISFAIALDLIGGDGDLVVNGAGMLIGAAEMRWLADAAKRAGVAIDIPVAHRVVSRWWPQAERSDHGPFSRRGTRAIHFYNRGHGGEWIDRAYHSFHDVAARVQRRSVDDTARLLRMLIATPPPVYAGDGFWLPFVHGIVVPRAVLIAFEILLVLIVVFTLVMSRAGLLAWLARSRDERRGPALIAGMLCYAAAVGAAFAIERFTRNGHPAVWTHAPLRALLGHALVIAGAFGLATRAVARFAPWRGESRYLAVAAGMPLAIGLALLVLGAAEIAWAWLVPAAAIALAPLVPRSTAPVPRGGRSKRDLGALIASRFAVALAVVASLIPLAAVLHPQRLREAIWNAFLPPGVPLSLLVGLFGIPVVAAVAWALRRRTSTGPTGTLVLGMGCALLVISGLVVAITSPVLCTPAEFIVFVLGCERV